MSSAIIITPPEEVFDRFNCLERNGDMEEVARNDAYDVSIYIAMELGAPAFVVEICNEEVYREPFAEYEERLSDNDYALDARLWCEAVAEDLYARCLSAEALDYLEGDPMYGDNSEDMLDYDTPQHDGYDEYVDREYELDNAFDSILYTIIRNSETDLSTGREAVIIEDIKDKLIEYIARKYDINVWRPMTLVDDDGEDFIEEYPYSHLIYDGEVEEIFDV